MVFDARRSECSERALGGEREVSSSSRERERAARSISSSSTRKGHGRRESANDSYVSPFLPNFALPKPFAWAKISNCAKKP